MAGEYVKRCLISLVIREIQVQTKIRFPGTPTRMAKTKKTDRVLVKIRRNTFIASGNVK